ncbi:MAG: hypothetical protein KDB69_05070, partial [Acidimicrobiia bacterium]|nr:hypothetical protein [Acidimicrobiia bacterium]
MARFFKAIKEQMRERETAQALLATDTASRQVLAYAEDDYSWNQLGPYLTRLMADERIPVAYVTSDSFDPRIDNHSTLFPFHALNESLPLSLPKADTLMLNSVMYGKSV